MPEPPTLLRGLFSDQQIPVVGSKTLPPGQGADVAVGVAVTTTEANTVLQRVTSRSAGALVRIFMMSSAPRGYGVILVCSSMS
ncbi:hypothetical protein [Mycolicibacterium frederiksbergense]|uniref:hypothetical protein n=1 Tax=Mycolicibacterium frederiksbergense TaxID=117567 RepID=UPI002476DC3A|nr:hypothetical protein [Mycolicibacterium frederiksbergense]